MRRKDFKELRIFPGVRPGSPLQAAFEHQGREDGFSPLPVILLTEQTLPGPTPQVAAKTRVKELSKAMGQAVNHLKLQFPFRRRKPGVPSSEPGTRGRRRAFPSCPPSTAFSGESG